MSREHEEQAFASQLAQALRAHETLDAATAARLRAARQQALAQRGRGPWLRWSLPAAGAVAAGLLVFALLPAQVPRPAAGEAEIFELLADEMEPERYRDLQQNAEFYRWLATEGQAGRPHV